MAVTGISSPWAKVAEKMYLCRIMNLPKKVAFHTLGCKLNYSETSTIARMFIDNGFEKVDFAATADVYVINTCSVTENADKECKKIVRSALQASPDAFVIIVGCYAQLKPQEIAAIEGVDLVLGTSEKFKILNYITDLTKKSYAEVHSCEIEEANFFVDAYSFGDRTRVFLKVQDGCDYTCSYCTIPLARGKSRSDSIENILTNVHNIAELGVKEVVLTGVNIGDFGFSEDVQSEYSVKISETDLIEPASLTNGVFKSQDALLMQQTHTANKKRKDNFLDLIRELDKVNGIERFRISSIEPNLLKDEMIEFVAKSTHFVPHFHIPLQSGSNKILKLMRRRYLRELYTERVNHIKQHMPHCCIGVDVIVGFPGETDADFLDTYNFINGLDISYLHVFTYSERSNTDAVRLKDAVPLAVRKQRNKMLRMLSVKKLRYFYEQHVNTDRIALFEAENDNGFMYGFTDNYIKIKTPYRTALINKLSTITIIGIDTDGIATIKEPELIPA